MAYSDTSFSEQLDQVNKQFRDLSTTLKKVCENLKEPGSPPSSEILEKINSAIESCFEELKSCVIEWAKSVQLPDIPDAQNLDSIKAITTFSKNIVAHQNDVQDEKILEYINRARSIKYAKEGESFPPLDDFLGKLDKLENRVSTPLISDEEQKDRTQILENNHPINGVLTLLGHGDELDQKSYDQISEIISEQYGHSFMIAAVRGSLILPDQENLYHRLTLKKNRKNLNQKVPTIYRLMDNQTFSKRKLLKSLPRSKYKKNLTNPNQRLLTIYRLMDNQTFSKRKLLK